MAHKKNRRHRHNHRAPEALVARARSAASAKAADTRRKAMVKLAASPPGIPGYDSSGRDTGGFVPTPAPRSWAEAAALLPEGWVDDAPDVAVGAAAAAPQQCSDAREALLAWIAAGFTNVEAAFDADRSERTYAACWEGAVVDIHAKAVDAAVAIVMHAQTHIKRHGWLLAQMTRSEAGLPEMSVRRVLACVCDHETCADSKIEAPTPAANAALELRRPDIGFVAPATAVSAMVRQCGIVGRPSAAREAVLPAVCARLGLDRDWRRQRPINTADMAHDSDGKLLAVRPTPPSKGNRPSHDIAAAFIASHPDGVSVADIAKHFAVSAQTARRVVDDLNPEFVWLRSDERCIVAATAGRKRMWKITSDPDEIDAGFKLNGTPGREYDTVLSTTAGGEVILSSRLVRRW